MIISINAENSFDKIQHFHDKSSDETRSRRNLPQHNKGCIQQAFSQQHTEGGKVEAISSKVMNETMVSMLSTLVQPSFGILSQSKRQEEEIQRIQIGKEEIKLSLICR
jgi:hypothetical protein